MSITIFGAFWLIVLTISVFRGEKATFKCLIFSALFQAGAVIIIGGDKPISPLLVSAIAYICSCLIWNRKWKLRVPNYLLVLLVFIIVAFFTSLIAAGMFQGLTYMECTDWIQYNQYDGHIALWGLFVLFVYAICAIFVFNNSNLKRNEIDSLMTYMVLFVFLVGVWAILTIMQYIPRSSFVANFIYSNSTTRDNIAFFVDIDPTKRIYSSIFGIRFYGSFMEPSYCAGFLAMSFAYYVSKPKLEKKDMTMIIIILMMAVWTFSATAYLSVAFAGIASVFVSGKMKESLKIVKRGLILTGIGIFVITCVGWWDTIQRLIINKSDTHSAYIRNLWNVNALKTFIDTYGIGMGYSNVRGSSLIFTLPASLGLLGTTLFIVFIVSLLYARNVNDIGKNNQSKIFKLMFASVVVAMAASISVMDYSIFWISLYMCVTNKTVMQKGMECYEQK